MPTIKKIPLAPVMGSATSSGSVTSAAETR